MRAMIIDTETSGLFDFSRPADAEGQPRLAQLAMIPTDDRPGWTAYVRPEGWRMDPKAAAVNGLTDKFLAEHGLPIGEVLDRYVAAISDGYVIAAYNAQFDTKILRAELRRAGRADLFEQTPNICLMRAMKPVVGIRGRRNPKLSEALEFIGATNASAHDAPGDAAAALEVFRFLEHIGELPEPKVHYAKKRPVA